MIVDEEVATQEVMSLTIRIHTIMAIKVEITRQDVRFYPHHTFLLILCVSRHRFCILRPGLVLDHKAIPPLMILR